MKYKITVSSDEIEFDETAVALPADRAIAFIEAYEKLAISAQQKMHPTPESLASSQAVVNARSLSQSDSESTPAQARVI